MQVIWHGHSFVEIETDTGSIFIDPFISGNPMCDITIEGCLQKKVRAILLTHGHGDHIGDALILHQGSKAQIVCEYGVGAYFEKEHDITCIVGSIGGTVHCDDISIKFFNAPHGGGIVDNSLPYKCISAGLLVTVDGKTIYHAGDTSLTYDMKLLGEYYTIDVACVPIGDVYTMGVVDGARAVGMIKPKVVFPLHYNTWPKIKVDAIDFARLVMQDTKTVPKVLQPGQCVVL